VIIANMATYPPRAHSLPIVLSRLAPQVDQINLVLNEFDEVPKSLAGIPHLNPILPDRDYKDLGKFVSPAEPDDIVVLCDDDIIYPDNYVRILHHYLSLFSDMDAIVGIHGIIYSDFFDGDAQARIVYVFHTELTEHRVVNQLGSGTVMLRGRQLPPLDFMLGSERFVDLRLARYAYLNKFPMVCLKRRAKWLDEIKASESVFETFTKGWPQPVVREAQTIAGFHKLDIGAVEKLLKIQSGRQS
jgi:hypothetical protein